MRARAGVAPLHLRALASRHAAAAAAAATPLRHQSVLPSPVDRAERLCAMGTTYSGASPASGSRASNCAPFFWLGAAAAPIAAAKRYCG